MIPHNIQVEVMYCPGVYTTNAVPWSEKQMLPQDTHPTYVTTMEWFYSVVLNQDVLSLAIEGRCDIYVDSLISTPAS